MTPQAVLTELLDRIAASHGERVLVGADELADWPAEAVTALQSEAVITRARPAVSTICPGCERECVMPVHTPTGAGHAVGAFIVCDKRSDINRVSVPASRLEQWQASGDSIADSLARLLGLHRLGADTASEGRWEVGMFKGSKHAGPLVLVADGKLTLSIAGHFIPLASVMTLDEGGLKADKHVLLRELDGDDRPPSAGIGSPAWRTQHAKAAADARHNRPGGSRDKQKRIREIWATGKYTSRDRCAEEECAALDMSYSAARKALRNTPDP